MKVKIRKAVRHEGEKRRKEERSVEEEKIFCYSVRVFLTGQTDQSGFKVRYRDGRASEGAGQGRKEEGTEGEGKG